MSAAQRFLGRMSCWTPTAALLLGVLLGAAAGAPAPDAAPLDRRWETLFSRSVLWVSGEKPELSWETDYLLGIQRVRRLYCNVGIGFHLQVLPDGGISGAHSEDPYSEFLLRAEAGRQEAGAEQVAPRWPPLTCMSDLCSSLGELHFF